MKHVLSTGEFLRAGEYLVSPDNQSFHLIMQRDGNLCLYTGGHSQGGRCLWAALGQSQAEGDYFAAMQADGHFCIYRGTPETSGEFVWGTGTQAKGEAFFVAVENGGVVTVNYGQPPINEHLPVVWASRKVRLLTYNTHLMEGSAVVTGATLSNKLPVVFHDEPRHRFIVDKIKQSGADIVALQEVWSADRMDKIREDLKDVYPYSQRGTNGPLIKAGSGIVLVSKFPIEAGDFVEYGLNPFDEDFEDMAASKGFRYDRVKLPDNGSSLCVGMTHAWTNAGSKHGCENIDQMLRRTREFAGSDPMVLMGDFNIHRIGNPDKFRRLTDHMEGLRAFDSWTRVHGEGNRQGSVTDDQTTNTLDQFFSPDRDTPDGDCLDYIYLKDGEQAPLRLISAQVLRDWHYPLTSGSPWYWVHPGTTDSLPSAAAFGHQLCVAVRRNKHIEVHLFDGTTRKWRYFPNIWDGKAVDADGAPGVVWFNNTLHLFFQRGGQVYKMESKDGERWSAPNSQGGELLSSGGVCPIVHENVLYVFCRDPGGSQVCVNKWTNRWKKRVFVGIDTRHDISAASLNGKLCAVSIDDGAGPRGLMRSLSTDGKTWRGGQLERGAVTSGTPGVTAHNGRFELFFRDGGGNAIYHRSSVDGEAWSAIGNLGQNTDGSACPVVWNGGILVFFDFVPRSHEQYSKHALAHMHYPPVVELDASDHYPYMVDVVWPAKR